MHEIVEKGGDQASVGMASGVIAATVSPLRAAASSAMASVVGYCACFWPFFSFGRIRLSTSALNAAKATPEEANREVNQLGRPTMEPARLPRAKRLR